MVVAPVPVVGAADDVDVVVGLAPEGSAVAGAMRPPANTSATVRPVTAVRPRRRAARAGPTEEPELRFEEMEFDTRP